MAMCEEDEDIFYKESSRLIWLAMASMIHCLGLGRSDINWNQIAKQYHCSLSLKTQHPN